jgi:molybdenum cofactor biosynthesis protein B
MTGADSNKPTDQRPFVPVRIAVLTVSDTRTLETDKSGQLICDMIAAAGHQLSARTIVKDDIGQIRRTARNWLKREDIDVVISTGGTGLTGRDVTVEAFKPLFEKEIEGFGVAFHILSWGKIGTSTVQSRATAGISKGKFIFCLPGSPGACRDGWEGILKAQLDYRHKPCNFVEILPRLEEHLQRRNP